MRPVLLLRLSILGQSAMLLSELARGRPLFSTILLGLVIFMIVACSWAMGVMQERYPE